MADDSDDMGSLSSMSFHEDHRPSSPSNGAYPYAEAGGPRSLREEYLEMGPKFRDVERRRKALDETVAELKQAVLLRMEMNQCASRRETPSVRVELEVKFLYPDMMLVMAKITNESSFHFKNWHLSFTFSPQESDKSPRKDKIGPRTVCEAVPLASLPEGHRFDVNLTTRAILDADALVEITLHKRFQVGEDVKIFRIELDPCAITKWDLLQDEPYVFPRPLCDDEEQEGEEVEKYEEHTESLRLPHKMMYLLVCGKNASVADVAHYIMPKNFANATDETATITGFIPADKTVAEIHVEVRRQDLCTLAKISSTNERLVRDLVAGLQRRILLHLSRVWRRPKDQLSLPPTISFSGELQPLWKDMISYWR